MANQHYLIQVIDDMIEETKTRGVPDLEGPKDLRPYGKSLGIGVRLGILQEVRDRLVEAEAKQKQNAFDTACRLLGI